jgi:hypothetical protein
VEENLTDTGNAAVLDGSNDCSPVCASGIEFCGKDGTCKQNSCENFTSKEIQTLLVCKEMARMHRPWFVMQFRILLRIQRFLY